MFLFYFFILCCIPTTITPTQVPPQPILLALDCDNEENIFLLEQNLGALEIPIIFEILRGLGSTQPPCIITNHHMLESIVYLGTIMDGILNQEWDDNDFLNKTRKTPCIAHLQYFDHLLYFSVYIKNYLACITPEQRISFYQELTQEKKDKNSVLYAQHTDHHAIMLFFASYLIRQKLKKLPLYKDTKFYYIPCDQTQAALLQANNCTLTSLDTYAVPKTTKTNIQTLGNLPLIIQQLLTQQHPENRILYLTGHGNHKEQICASLTHENIKKIMDIIPHNSMVILDSCDIGGVQSAQLFADTYPFNLFIRGGIEVMSTMGQTLTTKDIHEYFTESENNPCITFYDAAWDMFQKSYAECPRKNKAKELSTCLQILLPYKEQDGIIANNIFSVKKAGQKHFCPLTTPFVSVIHNNNKNCDVTLEKNVTTDCIIIEPALFEKSLTIAQEKMPVLMAFELSCKVIFRTLHTIQAPNITLEEIILSFFKVKYLSRIRGLSLANVSCKNGSFSQLLCSIRTPYKNALYNTLLYKNTSTGCYYYAKWNYTKKKLCIPQDIQKIDMHSFEKVHAALIRKFTKLTKPCIKSTYTTTTSPHKKQKMQ